MTSKQNLNNPLTIFKSLIQTNSYSYHKKPISFDPKYQLFKSEIYNHNKKNKWQKVETKNLSNLRSSLIARTKNLLNSKSKNKKGIIYNESQDYNQKPIINKDLSNSFVKSKNRSFSYHYNQKTLQKKNSSRTNNKQLEVSHKKIYYPSKSQQKIQIDLKLSNLLDVKAKNLINKSFQQLNISSIEFKKYNALQQHSQLLQGRKTAQQVISKNQQYIYMLQNIKSNIKQAEKIRIYVNRRPKTTSTELKNTNKSMKIDETNNYFEPW